MVFIRRIAGGESDDGLATGLLSLGTAFYIPVSIIRCPLFLSLFYDLIFYRLTILLYFIPQGFKKRCGLLLYYKYAAPKEASNSKHQITKKFEIQIKKPKSFKER
jgi:hypothetical protein